MHVHTDTNITQWKRAPGYTELPAEARAYWVGIKVTANKNKYTVELWMYMHNYRQRRRERQG